MDVEADTAARAAEKFADARFAADSYPQKRTVHVREVTPFLAFDVETRNDPTFIASPKKVDVGGGRSGA